MGVPISSQIGRNAVFCYDSRVYGKFSLLSLNRDQIYKKQAQKGKYAFFHGFVVISEP